MMLFRMISWPYLRKHAVRSLLTVVGIVIGVSVFFAMHAANQSVFGAFQETVRRIAGSTDLQVSAGEPGFPEEVLERVQALTEVAVAAPVIEAMAGTGQAGQGNLLILGVDLTGDRGVRDYSLESGDEAVINDPLVFLAQPDSIMVSAEYARRTHLGPNARISLDTAQGSRAFVVRGVLQSGGFTRAFGGNLAVMDIYAVQQVFGRGRRFDRIDVALAKNVPLATGQAAIRAAVGPGFQVQPPAARGQSFQSILRIYYFILNFSSAFALVVGMFIIYSSFSIAVTQRRKEIGILRALGATRRQIALLFLGESALAGLIGSVVGVFVGFAAAGVMAGAIGSILHGVYGFSQGDVGIVPGTPLVVLTIAIGVLTSMAAAGIPARSAAHVDPVVAMQKGRTAMLSAGESRGRVILALVLGVFGVSALAATRSLGWFYVGYLCVMLAPILLTPVLAQRLSRILRPLLRWLRPVEGALAADSLIGSSRRTSATVGALMLSVALVIGLAGTARSSYNNIMDWASSALNPDFFVTTSPTLTDHNYRFADSMTPRLEAVAGIEQVIRMRTPRTDFQGEVVLLMTGELEKLEARSPFKAVSGNPAEMYRLAAAGQGVLASENFATLRRLVVGNVIELPSPSGAVRVPVVGIVRDYADQQGAVFLDRSLYRQRWDDDSIDHFRVFLRPGADPDTVRGAILQTFSADRRLFVLSNAEVRQYVAGLTNQWFAITWVQISVAILVAILGIINSLTVTIADRRRELGILRAVGGSRGQVRGTLWMEAVALAMVGVILGLAVGAVHLYYVLELTFRDFPGMRFDYVYPYRVALLLVPIICAAALISAFGPAEAACRGSLVEALEYE